MSAEKHVTPTLRKFYIDGVLQFGLFDRGQKTVEEITQQLLKERDFISLKQHFPEWESVKFLTWNKLTEEVYFQSSPKKEPKSKKTEAAEVKPVVKTIQEILFSGKQ